MGDPTNNVTWETYEQIAARPDVGWTVPISLGDSHRGFRVVGTTDAYFEHYRFGDSQSIQLADGVLFDDLFDVVLGAQVARELDYGVGTTLTLSHGLGATSFVNHDDKPFRVTGVLAPTGTPVDRSLYVSLGAIEAIHMGWQDGTPTPMSRLATPERLRQMRLEPESITAMLVGATSRVQTLRLQRALNTYAQEPLQAVIPGVALSQLWNIVSVVERALTAIAAFVVAVGLIGILTSILTSLNERRREMAILRSVGAKGRHIVALLVSEAALLAGIGATLGIGLLYGGLALFRPVLEARVNLGGISLVPGVYDLGVIAAVTGIAALLGLIPALMALRRSLSDGLSVRF
ncbi:MAG: ABC transporter permease [Litorimonas sp.]